MKKRRNYGCFLIQVLNKKWKELLKVSGLTIKCRENKIRETISNFGQGSLLLLGIWSDMNNSPFQGRMNQIFEHFSFLNGNPFRIFDKKSSSKIIICFWYNIT